MSDYTDYIYTKNTPTYNSFGETGLIQTPSAEIQKEASIYFVYNKNPIYKYGSLVISPFDWMEASYFYYRPVDLIWGGKAGKYLDKGFNVKLRYQPKNSKFPNIALGLNDFAGTGQFSREYIVATKLYNNFKFSFGLGTGKFNGQDQYKNPLSYINESFGDRSGAYNPIGGTLTTDQWFKGPVSPFGGIEINIPKSRGIKFKAEYDPYDYFIMSCCGEGISDLTYELRTKDSNINYGLSFPLGNHYNLEVSYIKGNQINFTFSIGANFFNELKQSKKKKFKPIVSEQKTSNNFYEDLLFNLNRNNFLLQSADIDKDVLKVAINNGEYRNPIRLSSNAAYTTKKILENHILEMPINSVEITNINGGFEINKIKYFLNDLSPSTPIEIAQKNTEIIKIKNESNFKNNRFKPRLDFPLFFYSINPTVLSHLGSPERFYFKGLALKLNSEIKFSRNASIFSELGFNLYDTFDEKESRPTSSLAHVRSEIVDYLQARDEYVSRLEFEYRIQPNEYLYAKINGGILEQMFNGLGGEVIYKPFKGNFYIGTEYYKVYRRSYGETFKNIEPEYSVDTYHLNMNYFIESLGVMIDYSYGKYLAKDVGYTLDLSKMSKSGFKAGFFFTRTDVDFGTFGEGSFDKGFYFSIPFDLFTNQRSVNRFNFKLRPLSRDGGQKLNRNELIDLINNSSYEEINRGWDDGFIN